MPGEHREGFSSIFWELVKNEFLEEFGLELWVDIHCTKEWGKYISDSEKCKNKIWKGKEESSMMCARTYSTLDLLKTIKCKTQGYRRWASGK